MVEGVLIFGVSVQGKQDKKTKEYIDGIVSRLNKEEKITIKDIQISKLEADDNRNSMMPEEMEDDKYFYTQYCEMVLETETLTDYTDIVLRYNPDSSLIELPNSIKVTPEEANVFVGNFMSLIKRMNNENKIFKQRNDVLTKEKNMVFNLLLKHAPEVFEDNTKKPIEKKSNSKKVNKK